jgi:hypothetical protein
MTYQCPKEYLEKVFIATGGECVAGDDSEECTDPRNPCNYCVATEAWNEAFEIMNHAMHKIERAKAN